ITNPSRNVSADIKIILSSIQQISITDILERLTSIESHLTESDERLTDVEARLAALTSTVSELRSQLDDQENRAQWSNISVLGFPEGVEQGNPTKFLEEALSTILQLPAGMDLSIERAHHSLALRPAPGQRPRPFIIKLLRFLVKELLLKSARELGMLQWEGHKILLFPDLSKALQDRRQQFLPAKKILHDKSIKYGLFYPATLRVTYKGSTLSFGSAEKVDK
uniref:L1 transposable element RRM domain-containing protein n=1 Tax=Latimeria chalumnae TaxID=7897 RepID=H2ZVC8_LATCH